VHKEISKATGMHHVQPKANASQLGLYNMESNWKLGKNLKPNKMSLRDKTEVSETVKTAWYVREVTYMVGLSLKSRAENEGKRYDEWSDENIEFRNIEFSLTYTLAGVNKIIMWPNKVDDEINREYDNDSITTTQTKI